MNAHAARPRIGLIGAGTIARAIVDALRKSEAADVAYVLARNADRARALAPGALVTTDADEALAQDVDLVVEAATPDVVKSLAPRILDKSDFCPFSLTALADPSVEVKVEESCRASGRRLLVPHGAVLALDGLSDGRDAIETVTVTTTKSAKSFGLPEDMAGVAFEGSAREACGRFPRNVNVHAAVALAGIGFDRTRSRIVVRSGSEMRHDIEVHGSGLDWTVSVASQSLGGVTGSYTPLSAANTVLRIVARRVGLALA